MVGDWWEQHPTYMQTKIMWLTHSAACTSTACHLWV